MKKGTNIISRMRRKTLTRVRIIKGRETTIRYHYYPGRRAKLYAVIDGRVKMSYAGVIATTIYNRMRDEQNKQTNTSKRECRA